MTELLSKHYERKVIILIDEYDVPLDKAFHAGYYNEIVDLARNLFSNVLKTNPDLQFAVLTGGLGYQRKAARLLFCREVWTWRRYLLTKVIKSYKKL